MFDSSGKLLLYMVLDLLRALKPVDTNGNCQRHVFLLGVSQQMHKITKLGNIELNYWLSKLRDNNERKDSLVTRSCVLLDA